MQLGYPINKVALDWVVLIEGIHHINGPINYFEDLTFLESRFDPDHDNFSCDYLKVTKP
jgi:hypothetical protein